MKDPRERIGPMGPQDEIDLMDFMFADFQERESCCLPADPVDDMDDPTDPTPEASASDELPIGDVEAGLDSVEEDIMDLEAIDES